MASVLTAKSVEMAQPHPTSRREIADGALPGLYLVVQPSGVKSWALRYRFGGKPKKLTVGPTLLKRVGDLVEGTLPLGQSMTLPEARRAAREALQQVAEGTDPSAKKKAAKAVAAAQPIADRDLVRNQGEQFLIRYCKARNRSWREVERQFKVEIYPSWGDRKVEDIAKRDVMELLDAIIDRGSPMTANRVFATLRRFFGWLIERDVIAVSPCAGIKKPSPEKSRERILSDDEIKLLWRATTEFEYPFGPMWRLLLLTGQRREEVAGMLRKELDISGDKPTWTIPGSRTKNGKTHVVPLAPAAAEIIGALPIINDSDFVFTTTGESHVTGFSRSKARLDAKMIELLQKDEGVERDALEPFTLHDLRRTMASGMAKLGINLPVIEKSLNHVSGSFGGIVGVYQHHDFADEKRVAFEAWANFVREMIEDQASNVVRLRDRLTSVTN